MIDIDALKRDKRPQSSTIVHALIDRLEAAESEAIEQARLNGMGAERELALMAKLEAAEKSDAESLAMYRRARDERDALRAENEALAANLRGKHSTTGATYAHLIEERDALRADKATLQQMMYSLKDRLEVAEKSDAESIAMYRRARDERDELCAKIARMERQEPVAWIRERDDHRRRKLSFESPVNSSPDKLHWFPLGILPGAQPKPDCGEAGHDEGRCGNRQCLPGAQTQGEGK